MAQRTREETPRGQRHPAEQGYLPAECDCLWEPRGGRPKNQPMHRIGRTQCRGLLCSNPRRKQYTMREQSRRTRQSAAGLDGAGMRHGGGGMTWNPWSLCSDLLSMSLNESTAGSRCLWAGNLYFLYSLLWQCGSQHVLGPLPARLFAGSSSRPFRASSFSAPIALSSEWAFMILTQGTLCALPGSAELSCVAVISMCNYIFISVFQRSRLSKT